MEYIFTWTFQTFSACVLKEGDFVKSPVFTAENLDETKWYIQLYPRGNKSAIKEFISCYLYRSIDCAGPIEVECDYTIEAIDEIGKSLIKLQYVNTFRKGASFGLMNFCGRSLILINNTCLHDIFTVKVILKKMRPMVSANNICLTKFVTDQLSFKWSLKNSISSNADIKPFAFLEGIQFKVIVDKSVDDIEISIQRVKGFTESQILICSVTLLDLKGYEAKSKRVVFEADDLADTCKFPTFLKISKMAAKKDKYLENEFFTLKFNFAFSIGKMSHIECRSLDISMKTNDLSYYLKTDLKQVLTNHIHTDVELIADEKVFRAHKVILCARSPVFLAMFNQDMIENQTGAINISDVEAATLNSLLEFMYTGDIEILNYESALKLLLVADKYQVLSLKEECSSALKVHLSDENVCDILFTADLVQHESLKELAVNHIKERSKTIFKSDEWKQLAEKNLKLATETFCEVSTLLAD